MIHELNKFRRIPRLNFSTNSLGFVRGKSRTGGGKSMPKDQPKPSELSLEELKSQISDQEKSLESLKKKLIRQKLESEISELEKKLTGLKEKLKETE